jgi:hypothetical protein
MAETGCLKDGHFQNLQVENTTILDAANVTMESDNASGSTFSLKSTKEDGGAQLNLISQNGGGNGNGFQIKSASGVLTIASDLTAGDNYGENVLTLTTIVADKPETAIRGALSVTGQTTISGSLVCGGNLTGYRREVLRQSDFDTSASLTVQQSGALVLLDNINASIVVSLPTVGDGHVGVQYTFMTSGSGENASHQIETGHANDLFVGGVTNLFNASGQTLSNASAVQFLSTGDNDRVILLGPDGGGSIVTCTAIVKGNVPAGTDDTAVWAVTGNKVAQSAGDTGDGFFSPSLA